MPECDILEFDYVSSKRPSPDAKIFDGATFDRFMSVLHGNEAEPITIVEALRFVSNHIYVTSLQLRTLLGSFRHDSDRTEVFIVYFMRVIDMHNEKVFRVRFENPEDLVLLRNRLG